MIKTISENIRITTVSDIQRDTYGRVLHKGGELSKCFSLRQNNTS